LEETIQYRGISAFSPSLDLDTIANRVTLKNKCLGKQRSIRCMEGAMSGNEVTRRGFMVRMIISVVMFIGAVLAVPFGGFVILPALRKRAADWADAGSWKELTVNEPQERRFNQIVKSGWQVEKQERSVWLVRKPDDSLIAYSPGCPHLGCGYRWFPQEHLFKCPCHASVFDIAGNVVSGPAPRPLDSLATKIEGDRVLVKYEIFQLGVARKAAA
jgi:menaquinol-cytochrome c reductase iron-sulfur subunit